MYTFKENDVLYDWISVLIPDRVYFGPYPSQHMVDNLIKQNFNLIVDLTSSEEPETLRYNIENYKYMTFPIPDNSFPEDPVDFCKFILTLGEHYKKNKKIYIHCRGGHGRSSMVSMSLMCVIGNDFKSSVDAVVRSHNDRVVLRPKWKKRSPINHTQFGFLTKIHKNLYINIGYYSWLLTLSEEIEKNPELHNKDIECRLKLTYLRKFIMDEEKYIENLSELRKKLFLITPPCPD